MGQPIVRQFTVEDEAQLQSAVMREITNGYAVADRTATSVTLIKKKQLSMFWMIVGLFVFVLPLFIYLIVYSAQSDQIIELRVVPRAVPEPAVETQRGPVIQMSPEGTEWWDGDEWRDVRTATPPTAQRSDDGKWWWDGSAWHEVAPTP